MAAARRPDGSQGEPTEQPDGARLEQLARELYELPPEEFTAARTAAVKRLRADGDRVTAREVGTLRRPALAAWAVNLLVRERAELVEELTAMGDSLREAQAQLDGAALRDLNRQRRHLVTAVAAEVGAVASAHDHPLGAAASRQVEETVHAALVDPRAAVAVRSGLLAQPLTSTGVESLAEALGAPLPDGGASAARPSGRPAPGEPEPTGEPGPTGEGDRPALSIVGEDEQAARRAAQERVAAAEKAARKAVKARDKAVAARSKAQARVLQAEAAVEELRGRLAEAEAQAEDAAGRLASREAAAESAEASVREAQQAAAAAAWELSG